jgi:DNA-binding MarR family transcriptional regulator
MPKSAKPSTRHTPQAAAYTDLVLETFRLNGRLLVAGDTLTRDLGLTSARWQVIGTLDKFDGGATASQIARGLGLRRQSVQRLVDVLAGEGIVLLEDNPNHRRAKLVRLSRKGHAIQRKLKKLQVQWANDIARDLPVAELRSALALMRTLHKRLN